jgi:flagellar biosynthesis/type III secretory pathway protein FliH
LPPRVSVLFLALGAPVAADDHHRYHGGALDARQHGYEHGYREGFHQGLNAHERNASYKPAIKEDDAGYEKFMGDKDDYQKGYREGFRLGYEDGYYGRTSRFGTVFGPLEPWGRGDADRAEDIYAERAWGGRDVAYDIGYRDGLIAGNDDFVHHREFKPEKAEDYKKADHGYRANYGDKEMYRRNYRDGFVQGYRDGFRGLR